MADTPTDEEQLSIYLANEIVSLANSKLSAGLSLAAIASALRHAAANFSAYANAQENKPEKSAKILITEFSKLIHEYQELHNPDNEEKNEP
jgi:hypothetical protein